MTEDIPAKRKRGRPRKQPTQAPVVEKVPMPERNPDVGKHKIEVGSIASYNCFGTAVQFKALRRVTHDGSPTWIWGSARGDNVVDMVVPEAECLLLRSCV